MCDRLEDIKRRFSKDERPGWSLYPDDVRWLIKEVERLNKKTEDVCLHHNIEERCGPKHDYWYCLDCEEYIGDKY